MTDTEYEYIDYDGYPTEYAIERIENFVGTPRELVDLISSIWWADLSSFEQDLGESGEPCWRWKMATGGWSGNETIIGVLEQTFFWMNFWQSSRRGGGYTFEIPLDRIDERDFIGYWKNYKPELDNAME